LVFHQSLRQTEGLLRSLLNLIGIDLPVPDHTMISRWAAGLTPALRTALPSGPVTLVIDSTGLKVYGAGEWHRDKHGVRGRRTWRKLHLAVDAATKHAYVHESDRHFHQSGHLRFNHSRHFVRATAGPASWGGACRWRLT
jgi:hypothetical protein